jgi:rare lipoprotein A
MDRRNFLIAAFGGFAVCTSPTIARAGGSRRTRRMVASWYGEEFAGRLMANGRPFDPGDSSIAAHKTLPFGTRIALENPDNGLLHEVIVQDRGPYEEGRDIDLSHAAAKRLGFLDEGVATLSAHRIDTPG